MDVKEKKEEEGLAGMQGMHRMGIGLGEGREEGRNPAFRLGGAGLKTAHLADGVPSDAPGQAPVLGRGSLPHRLHSSSPYPVNPVHPC
jgi:hypothetical protein